MHRVLSLIAPAALVTVLAAGCAPSKGDIEKSVRDELKTSLGVDIAAIDLAKQPDGSYAGTATAANGDVYDVTTKPPKGGRIEWKALPSHAMVERLVREMMEKELPVKVALVKLTKESSGAYSGTAELANGEMLSVTARWEGTNLHAEWKPLL